MSRSGGKIIEAHLRFADQWCDLNGKGWIEAMVRLYTDGTWAYDEGQIGWDQVLARWKARGPMNQEYVASLQRGWTAPA